MTQVRITVHLADEALSANGRQHWRVRADRTKALRAKAQLLHHGAARELGRLHPARLHLTVWVTWPDRRHRDVANLSPTIKALIDGSRDAFRQVNGLRDWDDDDQHLEGPDLRVNPHPSGRPGTAVLVFEWQPIEVEATTKPIEGARA